ncbi:ABC transporter substrate-binding protein [Salinimicrobium gaetbulicola]|uniref:ABC transporter substrate-binding protein n=1 Tax=Salinimicrobium gaetbulicola TaxID=999702 RepID=A0ABW3IJ05_9FLAO
MRVFYDQLDREIKIPNPPKRIISLVPSQTELLVDLGLEDVLIGVTKFCVHPKDLRQRKNTVGGTKQVHVDKIRKLAPEIILCNKEENTLEMVAELENIAPVHVSDVKSVDDSLELIREYGEIFGVREKASEIAGQIMDLREDFCEFIDKKPKQRVAYFIWKNPWMVVGKDTFIDHLLELNKFENVYRLEKSRYPEIYLDQLTTKNADRVFLSTEPYPFKEEDKSMFKKAVREDCIHIVDGEYFSWYGSRLIAAFDYFKKLHGTLSYSSSE